MFRLGATDHLQQSLLEGAFRRYGLSPDGAALIPCVVEDLGKPVGGLDREWQRVGFRRGFLCAPVDGDSIAFDRSRATLDLDSRPCRDADLKEPCPVALSGDRSRDFRCEFIHGLVESRVQDHEFVGHAPFWTYGATRGIPEDSVGAPRNYSEHGRGQATRPRLDPKSPKTSAKLATYLVSRSRTKNLAAMSVSKVTGDVPRLLSDPCRVRMSGHTGDPDSPAAELDEEQ